MKIKGTCAVDGCERLAVRRGWCQKHERRWQVSGSPLGTADHRPRRRVVKDGYVQVWAPDHPIAMASHYIQEHRKVWFDAHGPIPEGWHVHHINGDKADNRIENLEIKSASDHLREHLLDAGVVTNQYGTWPLRSVVDKRRSVG